MVNFSYSERHFDPLLEMLEAVFLAFEDKYSLKKACMCWVFSLLNRHLKSWIDIFYFYVSRCINMWSPVEKKNIFPKEYVAYLALTKIKAEPSLCVSKVSV